MHCSILNVCIALEKIRCFIFPSYGQRQFNVSTVLMAAASGGGY
jgi:hypothetical protein